MCPLMSPCTELWTASIDVPGVEDVEKVLKVVDFAIDVHCLRVSSSLKRLSTTYSSSLEILGSKSTIYGIYRLSNSFRISS